MGLLLLSGGPAGSSGHRRLEAVEEYLHASFLRPEVAQILREYVPETADQEEIEEVLEEAKSVLERSAEVVEAKVEKISEGLLGGLVDGIRRQALAEDLVRERERQAEIAFRLQVVRYYLELLEEDEILISLLSVH